MLEIDEMMPFYICGDKEMHELCQARYCGACKHITNPSFAKNKEAVELFNKFCETFHVCIDDYGRLVCTEKEVTK